MIKILIASDSFKHSVTAREAGLHLGEGLQASGLPCDISVVPMADGGEGTVRALVEATGGTLIEVDVHDPLMRPLRAVYGILGDKETAVIEMSAASGIELLSPEMRNPWITTTYGTGDMIRHALELGCRRIIVGIGGSATNDGGTGMAAALGYHFYDKQGDILDMSGGVLHHVARIDKGEVFPALFDAEIVVACDVDNPLTGELGAAAVYGPQKGADEEMVVKLDAGLEHLAQQIHSALGVSVDKVPGAGAAGGLGAGLMAFCRAELRPGFEIVQQAAQLEEQIMQADLVITGEGRIDRQTRYGKTPWGVAQMARKHHKPVIAVAGTLGEGAEVLYHEGFDTMLSIIERPMTLEEALFQAPDLLRRTGRRIGSLIHMGERLR